MNSANWSEDALKSWMEAQQSYWTQLSSQNAKVASPPPFPSAPAWTQGLTDWWQRLSPTAPPQLQDVLARVLDMGKVYMGLAERVYGSAQERDDTVQLEGWLNSLEQGFADWRTDATQAAGALGLNNALFAGWEQLVGSVQGMQAFQDVSRGLLHLPNAGLWQEHLQKALALPSFGPNAPTQERLQKLARLALQYQQAMDVYRDAFAQQGQASVTQLRQRIQALAAQGKPVTSLRALYDLWVDVSEEEYAQFAMSADYQSIYGNLVNSFLRLKQGVAAHLDQELRSVGLPVRADFQAALQKQQELRRDNQALRRQLQQVEARLSQLEQQLNAKSQTKPKPNEEVSL